MANENKVLGFIDAVNKEKEIAASKTAFMNSPLYKKKQLDANMDKAKDQCMEYIFADLYKNSLPLDNNYINCNDEKLCNDMKDFINRQVADKGACVYVRETIKRGNKSMERLMESVDRMVRDCFKDKCSNVDRLDPKDLDWSFDDEKKEKLDDLFKDANLDEVSTYIKRNVQAATEYEKQEAEEKKAEIKELESELAENDEATTEAVIESIIRKKNPKAYAEKVVYQPTLFEGIMINKFNNLACESVNDQKNCYYEAVGELTMLNINKALKFASYDRSSVQKLAQTYARG